MIGAGVWISDRELLLIAIVCVVIAAVLLVRRR